MSDRVYLDARAPLHPAAREAILAALDAWADPRRLHHEGRRAAQLENESREVLAGLLGCRPDELHPTASHTASLHSAVAAVAGARRRVGTRVVHSAVERGALIAAARAVDPDGTPVPVHRTGAVDLEAWRAALAEPTAVAALQHANPELGTIQPLAEAHEATTAAGVPLIVDAGASAGHVDVPAHWDLLAADPTGWGGPAGLGLLAVRRRVRTRHPGPEDDEPWSPGGVSLPLLAGAAAALGAVCCGPRGRPPPAGAGCWTGCAPAWRPSRTSTCRATASTLAAARDDVLVPVRRRRGAAHRARQAGRRGRLGVGVHREHPRAQPRAGRDRGR